MATPDTEKAVKEATEGPEVIEPDSEAESEHFEDASDGIEDLNKPDWSEGRDREGGDGGRLDGQNVEDEVKDSVGAVKGSPDFVDEAQLEDWGETLSQEELEQKRLEAVGFKLEGNSLYLAGTTLEACDKYTAGLRACPLQFAQDRAVLYANRSVLCCKGGYFSRLPIFLLDCRHLTAELSSHWGHQTISESVQFTVVSALNSTR